MAEGGISGPVGGIECKRERKHSGEASDSPCIPAVSTVADLVRDQEVTSSNPAGPRWFSREPTVVFVIPKVGSELLTKEDHGRSR